MSIADITSVRPVVNEKVSIPCDYRQPLPDRTGSTRVSLNAWAGYRASPPLPKEPATCCDHCGGAVHPLDAEAGLDECADCRQGEADQRPADHCEESTSHGTKLDEPTCLVAVMLTDTLYRRLAILVQSDPHNLSQKQVIADALESFLDGLDIDESQTVPFKLVDPQPADISLMCQAIQQDWCEDEKLRRERGITAGRNIEVSTIADFRRRGATQPVRPTKAQQAQRKRALKMARQAIRCPECNKCFHYRGPEEDQPTLVMRDSVETLMCSACSGERY